MAVLPKEEKRGVPAYMVSFGDMITLLLTFFILLVALADQQTAGLVGAGRGPLVKHINAKGEPGIMPGRMSDIQMSSKADAWWIPSQEGDPDELEEVAEKLDRELVLRFTEQEARLRYGADQVLLRMPVRMRFEDGRPILDESAQRVVDIVAESLRRRPERRVRINGDVPAGSIFGLELLESATQGRLIYQQLLRAGVRSHQMSLWGWGSSRSMFPSAPADRRNQGVTIEILDPPQGVSP